MQSVASNNVLENSWSCLSGNSKTKFGISQTFCFTFLDLAFRHKSFTFCMSNCRVFLPEKCLVVPGIVVSVRFLPLV